MLAFPGASRGDHSQMAGSYTEHALATLYSCGGQNEAGKRAHTAGIHPDSPRTRGFRIGSALLLPVSGQSLDRLGARGVLLRSSSVGHSEVSHREPRHSCGSGGAAARCRMSAGSGPAVSGSYLTRVCTRRAWVSSGLQGGAAASQQQHTPRRPLPAADSRGVGHRLLIG
jgi:hypothetical protein